MITITPSRRRGLLLLLVGFLVFLGCFAFPLGNLTAPEGSLAFWSVLPPVLGYLGAGVLARMFLGPRCLGKVLGLTLAAQRQGFSAASPWSMGRSPLPTPSPCPTAPSTWRPRPGSPFWGAARPAAWATGNC